LLPIHAPAILNADIPEYSILCDRLSPLKRKIISYGFKAKDYSLSAIVPHGGIQRVEFAVSGNAYCIDSPLIGEFQAYNLMCALALVVASGINVNLAVSVLDKVKAVRGRMELVENYKGASVFVDYAHTPDGLLQALKALRPFTQNRLIVLFGCGGDRDKGKRPQMAEIAKQYADYVVVTDDNPRTEDAALIRKEILVGYPQATEIPDRREAIKKTIQQLQAGDILLLAGKGHETYQIVGTTKYPFDEIEIVQHITQEDR
jgi:UDP-N-acetylmuramoyl-L-alanyl-D-glutamate--2,6-diaminopimelate ligase